MKDNAQVVIMFMLAIALTISTYENMKLKDELRILQSCYEYGGEAISSSYDVKSGLLRIECKIKL